MARIQALVDDLMLQSKVTETLRSAGHDVAAGGEPDGGADLIVADLDTADIPALAAAGPPALGYYSHVDVETRERALEAGITKVVPRSRMARELPELVAGLLDG